MLTNGTKPAEAVSDEAVGVGLLTAAASADVVALAVAVAAAEAVSPWGGPLAMAAAMVAARAGFTVRRVCHSLSCGRPPAAGCAEWCDAAGCCCCAAGWCNKQHGEYDQKCRCSHRLTCPIPRSGHVCKPVHMNLDMHRQKGAPTTWPGLQVRDITLTLVG